MRLTKPIITGSPQPNRYACGSHDPVSYADGGRPPNIGLEHSGRRDSNNSVFATYLLQNWEGSIYNANGISQLGSTIVSSGAPLVAKATLTAVYNSTTKMVTLTLTQSGGAAGGSANTTISLRKFQ